MTNLEQLICSLSNWITFQVPHNSYCNVSPSNIKHLVIVTKVRKKDVGRILFLVVNNLSQRSQEDRYKMSTAYQSDPNSFFA